MLLLGDMENVTCDVMKICLKGRIRGEVRKETLKKDGFRRIFITSQMAFSYLLEPTSPVCELERNEEKNIKISRNKIITFVNLIYHRFTRTLKKWYKNIFKF